MKNKLLIAALLMTSSSLFAATSSTFQKISLIQINGKDGYYYFQTENGVWEVGDCPNAVWAYVRPQSVQVADQILSVALAAKMAGKRVKFVGECDSNGLYLQADRINLE